MPFTFKLSAVAWLTIYGFYLSITVGHVTDEVSGRKLLSRWKRKSRLLGIVDDDKVQLNPKGPCGEPQCLNGGSCRPDDRAPGGFRCLCQQGYFGLLCHTVVNDCQQNPCHGKGSCVYNVNGFRCECFEGYHGDNCELDVQNRIIQERDMAVFVISILTISLIGFILLAAFCCYVESRRQALIDKYQVLLRLKIATPESTAFIAVCWKVIGEKCRRHKATTKPFVLAPEYMPLVQQSTRPHSPPSQPAPPQGPLPFAPRPGVPFQPPGPLPFAQFRGLRPMFPPPRNRMPPFMWPGGSGGSRGFMPPRQGVPFLQPRGPMPPPGVLRMRPPGPVGLMQSPVVRPVGPEGPLTLRTEVPPAGEQEGSD